MMILNSVWNRRIGLGGGTPQLHHHYFRKSLWLWICAVFKMESVLDIHDHRRKPADTNQNDFIGADIVSTGAVKTTD